MTDATVEGRLVRLAVRQETMISAINGLTDVMAQTRDLVRELMDWLQEPPANDLSGVLVELVAAVNEMRTEIAALPNKVTHAVRPDGP